MGVAGSSAPVTDRRTAAFQTLYESGHRVELAATRLGPSIAGLQAYHTSVVVDDVEYCFSMEGVTRGHDLKSHGHLPNAPAQVTYMGLTSIKGEAMQEYLRSHFKRGSYDLLRKNCNSFSDCSLYFLLDDRLDPKYRGLEQIGHAADKRAGLVQRLTGGDYLPNPEADPFSVEDIVGFIDKHKASQFR